MFATNDTAILGCDSIEPVAETEHDDPMSPTSPIPPTRSRRYGGPRQTFVPSPEEIQAECQKIQETWTDKERRKRSGRRRSFWLVRHVAPRRVLFGSQRMPRD